MLCVNAANISTDRERLMELNRGRADFRDISAETALVAIQGPQSGRRLRKPSQTSRSTRLRSSAPPAGPSQACDA